MAAHFGTRFKQALRLMPSVWIGLAAVQAHAADDAKTVVAPSDPAEIVVTATRQAEPLSKIAASVSALNEAALDRRGIKNVADIALMTPGLTLNPNGFGSQADISIRGISSQVGSATTGIYIDDTPVQTRVVGYSSTNTYPLVFDLDRVEVLRGPQGTLFGSGAEGGAVRFITPEPSLTKTSVYARAELTATKGGDPGGEVGVAFGAPIIRDVLGFRASIWTQHEGGYIDRQDRNPELTGSAPIERNANHAQSVVGRFALKWQAAPNLVIAPSVLLQDRKIHDISTFWEGADEPDGKLVNGQPLAQPDHDRFVLPAVRAQLDLPGVTVISNTSFFARVDDAIDDYSTLVPAVFNPIFNPAQTGPMVNFVPGDPGYAAYAQMRNVQTSWTQELRAQSSDKAARLSWVVGLFASTSQQRSYENIVDPKTAEVIGGPPADLLGQALIANTYSLVANSQGRDRQIAAFGEVNYHLTDALKLTAGLRVARATFIGQSYATGPFVGATVVGPRTSTTETPVTPKFGVSYQTDKTLYYAIAAKGYRIGGSNAPLSDFCDIGAQGYARVPDTYKSDSLWSYELGAKTKLIALKDLAPFVQDCIHRFGIKHGEWLAVTGWNFSKGNEPDAQTPNLRAALDRASRDLPVTLLGNDGHHGAYNSVALARAHTPAGKAIGFSKATLATVFAAQSKIIGVDAAGEPDGTVNEDARDMMDSPDLITVSLNALMKHPEKVSERLAKSGITAVQDALVVPATVPYYELLRKSGLMTFRANLMQLYNPEAFRNAAGAIDYPAVITLAKSYRTKFAGDDLIRAEALKIFADGVLEANPYATPPALPDAPKLTPYLQPTFGPGPDGKLMVTGYVDTASTLCADVRANPARYADGAGFARAHGYLPAQCALSQGQLQHDRQVILDYAKAAHLAGFTLHIHAISDAAVRTAIDAIEGARAADGNDHTPDTIAHLQLVTPEDVARIGRDHLFLAYTYSWANADPDYDLVTIPFFEHVTGTGYKAFHDPAFKYEHEFYPVRETRDAGGILVAGSDAPVNTPDPQPFVNMQLAITRAVPGEPAASIGQHITLHEALQAYTIDGARAMGRDREFGSLTMGKSADFIVIDQDVFALERAGKADAIGTTRVLKTWFRGKLVYTLAKP
ncbi:TonB-dependent receptor domain-containing protein [Novosphingobium sp.]|uniref:TonB-dependent receptor domain-containing protein n=1 Tax=Novosphingobium sp. TaxID=1874826 RepID=UPI003B52C8F3